MAVVEELTEEEKYLAAILLDQSGVDVAEFVWQDETADDGVFRCWDFQYPWYRTGGKLQIDQCARAIGKSIGIQMRAFSFPFSNAGEEMLITAPELIHLNPVTKSIEDRILASRITREMLQTKRGRTGIVQRPFEARFKNGSRIVGRIPQKDGKGVKGMHPKKLEMDEAQDYPEPGWIELTETLKYGDKDATWRAHGVTRGVRDYFWKLSQSGTGWTVHRYTAMHRPDWSDEERDSKSELYGSRHSPDYRRNILGAHGDAQNPLFVLSRLMECVDTDELSSYNQNEYVHVRISDEKIRQSGMPIQGLVEPPPVHKKYERIWLGADIGLTNHPTEILAFAEVPKTKQGGKGQDELDVTMRVIARFHLERVSIPMHVEIFQLLYDFYRPLSFAMDRTGIGLPLYQTIVEGQHPGLANAMRGYDFGSKIQVGWELDDVERNEWSDEEPDPIMANVLEYSSDQLRMLVDKAALRLPWDLDMLREFQGQTYQVRKSTQNPYGRKVFSQGKFHTLDAARMAILAWKQRHIEAALNTRPTFEPVLDSFVM